ncbi:Molybdenum cofactor sulfurase [Papilio machaon]|uniref:Molybdenum cofactor sulfurase n=1 Tax=Papilio machaon TaxID=76193 RepID=A0A0N1PI14_PAPMA|nr:Molybdenum cofactor sulfurase [Papilio machaon]
MSETITLSRVMDSEQMQAITSEFNRLGERCYLEHAGAALYPQSLLQHVHEDLLNNVYMNPHTDKYTRDCIEQIRCLVLNHFHTDPSKYSIIFTSGATQSLKLTIESFEFSSNTEECGSFVYLNENHTSVLGLREIAEDKNVDVINISHDNFLKSIKQNHSAPSGQKSKTDGNILLAYPAKSNFNGFKYPLDCVQNIKNGCLNRYLMKHLCKVNCNWYVLLDAAAYVPTNNLDLSITQPDFVCLSFYKIFGYPTGLGALLVKNTSADVLCKKRYFGGGTVDIVISGENFHIKRKILHERMEDGTLPFLSILALKHCFDMLHRLIPKTINNHIMDTISHHTFYLAKDLYNQLNELHHPNGKKAVVLYMDSDFSDIKIQGGIVTFNLLREDGSFVGFMEFQNMADLFNINVRTGCFCNSGSCQRHLNTSNREMKEMYKAGHKCGDEIDLINGNPTGKPSISVPLEPIIENKTKFASMCTSKVCMDMVKGYDCGDDVSDWISNALGISYLRLIKQSNTDVRPQKKNADGEQKLLSLCNQAQFLLINKASVRWLHGRIKDPMFSASVDNLTDRFRGNLIIDRAVELTEREWHRIIIGKHEFKVDGPCQRCHMICIDQQTGEKTAEPLRTISEQFAGKMRFGIYLSYVGPVNGMKDKALKVKSIVKPMINEDDISR